MRPTAREQSALRAPLNDILATEANVRILRALSEAPRPLNAGELARRAQLGRTSVYPALTALDETGIIDRIGERTHRLVQLNERHPLADAIRALFDAERARAAAVMHAIREATNGLTPLPAAVWIEPPSAENVVQVRVVDRAGRGRDRARDAAERLRDAVVTVERKLGVPIEVSRATRAELERIARRLEHAPFRERHERAEWDRITAMNDAVRRRQLLIALGERPARRERALPFLGVLPS